ncbi:hypothetical protein AVEN_105577-1 [Araneus ventricosus]|uniref:Uncharacterized protein n=1 Tax=Araneus ventricosus TaxID=182803 RepID=A0A4Y2H6T9_ARAVE|nr:hypothetical protein AVEN_105577-1 [Araneus ventricosus]
MCQACRFAEQDRCKVKLLSGTHLSNRGESVRHMEHLTTASVLNQISVGNILFSNEWRCRLDIDTLRKEPEASCHFPPTYNKGATLTVEMSSLRHGRK